MNTFVLLFALFTNPLPSDSLSHAGATSPKINAPARATSFMVSEDYAQLEWDAVTGAEQYKIQIRGDESHPVLILEDKTVWTNFYFRIANTNGKYSFRIATVRQGVQSAWSVWLPLDTKPVMWTEE